MRLFDSHAHLTDGRFDSDRSATLARAREAGVDAIVSIASDLQDARAAIGIAQASGSPRIFATAGLHPHGAHSWPQTAVGDLEELLAREEVVAVGETGLDFYYDSSPRELQLDSFRAQLGLAEKTGLPAVVHSRSAEAETASLIEEFRGRATGVLHCFSSGPELLGVGLAADWYVSFSGIITFKSFDDDELVRRVPRDRLLIETDSPYLAPVPKRGKRNEPALVAHVLGRLAGIRGEDPEALAEVTFDNACRFYDVAGAIAPG